MIHGDNLVSCQRALEDLYVFQQANVRENIASLPVLQVSNCERDPRGCALALRHERVRDSATLLLSTCMDAMNLRGEVTHDNDYIKKARFTISPLTNSVTFLPS